MDTEKPIYVDKKMTSHSKKGGQPPTPGMHLFCQIASQIIPHMEDYLKT